MTGRRPPAPGRIALWIIAVALGLVALFFLFQLVETLLPSNY